jgi:uncharacterized protein DUF4265
MKYQAGDYVAVHAEPAWRGRANFVFRVPIGAEDEVRRWEQLWWEKLSETRLVLCCVPFFVYDLSLGDEVTIDDDRNILEVSLCSGQWTYRVWFGDISDERRDLALERIGSDGIIFEWSSENLVALSVVAEQGQHVADVLAGLEHEGFLQYETGKLERCSRAR